MSKLVELGGGRGPRSLDKAKVSVIADINGVHQEFPPRALFVAKDVYGEGVKKLICKAYYKGVILSREVQPLINRRAPAKVYRGVARAQEIRLTLAQPGAPLHQHASPYPLEKLWDMGPRLPRDEIDR